jgi:hypothetical protein
MNRASILLVLWLLARSVYAESPPPFLRDSHQPGPKSWIQTPSGQWRGYGANQGRVWIQSPSGQWRGQGKDQGQSWIKTPSGQWRGYGSRRQP